MVIPLARHISQIIIFHPGQIGGSHLGDFVQKDYLDRDFALVV
jgi:hypothetical protein